MEKGNGDYYFGSVVGNAKWKQQGLGQGKEHETVMCLRIV